MAILTQDAIDAAGAKALSAVDGVRPVVRDVIAKASKEGDSFPQDYAEEAFATVRNVRQLRKELDGAVAAAKHGGLAHADLDQASVALRLLDGELKAAVVGE